MQRKLSRFFHKALLGAVCVGVLAVSTPALADYPIVSHRYLADPGSLVLDGRIYLYNSNDDDNAVGGGYAMRSIVCVSSSDLKNWTDHGVVFSVPANASWANHSWAPQPIARGGTIFLYFGNNANGVGVASSTNPTSGFKDAKGSALVSSSTPGASGTDSWLFDPGVLVDEDGAGYLAFGGNGESNARLIKLGADLVSVSGSAAALSPKGFYEAAFLFKRNAIYYMAYSTSPANGLRIDYLKSTSPMSGYTYGGIVGDQPPQNDDNNHASEFAFKDKWYHAYHNRVVAKTAGIVATYKRNLAIEVLEFNADDSIRPVTYTLDGVPQVGTLNPYLKVEAETTNAQNGIETETCSEGGMDVTEISTGDWIRVRGVDFGASGAKSFTARVASAAVGGSIELHLDTEAGAVIGTCTVPATGGAQMWADATCGVTGATGVKDLYLKFSGSFNFNYWLFTSADGNTGAGGASGAGGATVGGGGAIPAGGANSGGGANSSGGSLGSGGSVNIAGSGNSGGTAVGGSLGGNAGGAGAGLAGMAAASGASGEQDKAGCGCFIGGAPATPMGAHAALFIASVLALRSGRRRR